MPTRCRTSTPSTWCVAPVAGRTATAIVIPVQTPKAVRLKQNFTGHHPIAEVRLARATEGDETRFSFDGIGFAIQGDVRSEDGKDRVLTVDMFIDDVGLADTVELPTNFNAAALHPLLEVRTAQRPARGAPQGAAT